MWNIILMMVEAFDTNQKEKRGNEQDSEKLLGWFQNHMIIVPLSFLQTFVCFVNERLATFYLSMVLLE